MVEYGDCKKSVNNVVSKAVLDSTAFIANSSRIEELSDVFDVIDETAEQIGAVSRKVFIKKGNTTLNIQFVFIPFETSKDSPFIRAVGFSDEVEIKSAGYKEYYSDEAMVLTFKFNNVLIGLN